jgi:hypothetical protein
VPPVAARPLEYAVPWVPEGKLDVVIARPAAAVTAIERLTDLVCTGLDESATLKVTLDVPVDVGVPEITPDEARASPAGRPVGDEMDQV